MNVRLTRQQSYYTPHCFSDLCHGLNGVENGDDGDYTKNFSNIHFDCHAVFFFFFCVVGFNEYI